MKAPAPKRPTLSIADAWDEANAFLCAELGLIAPVALAFLALPAALGDLLAPDPGAAAAGGLATALLPLAWVVQLFGTVAIAILALKPGLSVAEALRAALRRMPSSLGMGAILLIGLVILLAPVLPYIAVPGHAAIMPSGGVVLYMLTLAVGLMVAGVRLSLANIVVAGEAIGPLAAIRRSVALTRGVGWRLAGFMFAFMLFGLVVVLAIGAGFGSLLLMAGRLLDQVEAAKVVAALLSASVAAALTAWLVVILARIYARLAGWSNGI